MSLNHGGTNTPDTDIDQPFCNMLLTSAEDADGEIVEFTRLGGLLKSYRRVKRAA